MGRLWDNAQTTRQNKHEVLKQWIALYSIEKAVRLIKLSQTIWLSLSGKIVRSKEKILRNFFFKITFVHLQMISLKYALVNASYFMHCIYTTHTN